MISSKPELNKTLEKIWLDLNRSRYFLIPENQNVSSGDFIILNSIGKKKEVELTAISDFEITEEEANNYLENELNRLLEQIEISEDIQQEISKMLAEIFSESNIEKYLSDFINKLVEIEDNPELLAGVIYEFYTSLSQEFFIEREKKLAEKRQQDYKRSAKQAVEKALISFTIPSFSEKDWMPEIDLLANENDRKI